MSDPFFKTNRAAMSQSERDAAFEKLIRTDVIALTVWMIGDDIGMSEIDKLKTLAIALQEARAAQATTLRLVYDELQQATRMLGYSSQGKSADVAPASSPKPAGSNP